MYRDVLLYEWCVCVRARACGVCLCVQDQAVVVAFIIAEKARLLGVDSVLINRYHTAGVGT